MDKSVLSGRRALNEGSLAPHGRGRGEVRSGKLPPVELIDTLGQLRA